jgi:hypothetical protein
MSVNARDQKLRIISGLPVARPESAADSNGAFHKLTFEIKRSLLAGFPVQNPRSEQI